MTPADSAAIKQIEDMLYAPRASDSIEACNTNLGKAQRIMAGITSEDGRRNAQYYITEFGTKCLRFEGGATYPPGILGWMAKTGIPPIPVFGGAAVLALLTIFLMRK